jgi:hypothetical protein
VSHALENLFATRHLQMTLISTAVPGTQRFYDSGSVLRQDVVNARIWLGFHFRTGDTASRKIGREVAAWTIGNDFQPVGAHG